MRPDAIVLIVYAAVAVIAVGVVRELEDDWDAVADKLPFIIAWPLAVPAVDRPRTHQARDLAHGSASCAGRPG